MCRDNIVTKNMRRTYRFEDMYEAQFEELVNRICVRALGTGVISFAPGKDGGRDGKFEGTANEYPSKAAPASGKFIIQAKWTSSPIASCADPEFQRIAAKEKPRVEELVSNGELDHYLMFTNRRKPAGTTLAALATLKGAGMKSAEIFGTEEMVRQLDLDPGIWRSMGLSDCETPFTINPSDLAEVVVAFREALDGLPDQFNSAENFTHINLATKNAVNGLTEEYSRYMVESSFPQFSAIQRFLSDPRNTEMQELYHDSADELKQKIVTNRDSFESFDAILTYVSDYVIERAPTLRTRKRYVRLFLHYMYHDCDIGQHA
jgi:hypothetical protein